MQVRIVMTPFNPRRLARAALLINSLFALHTAWAGDAAPVAAESEYIEVTTTRLAFSRKLVRTLIVIPAIYALVKQIPLDKNA